MTYTGNIQDEDILLITNGATNFKVTASILAEYVNSKEPAPSGVTTNILDTDLFLIADGTINYKITADDLANYINNHVSQPSGSATGTGQGIIRDSRWGGVVKPDQPAWYARVYANGTVAVNTQDTGSGTANDRILVSADGFNFGSVGSPALTTQTQQFIGAYHQDWPVGYVSFVDSGTVHTSTNHGVSLGTSTLTTPGISNHPKADGKVLAGFNGDAYLSTDYGNTWTQMGDFEQGSGMNIMLYMGASEDPSSTTWIGIRYDGTSSQEPGDIMRSADDGATWTVAQASAITQTGNNNLSKFDHGRMVPGEPGEWLACFDQGQGQSNVSWYSTDDGVSWSSLSFPTDNGKGKSAAYNKTTKTFAVLSGDGTDCICTSTTGPGGPYSLVNATAGGGRGITWREVDNQLYSGGFYRFFF